MRQVELPSATPASPRCAGCGPAASVPIQLPANGPGKAAGDGPSPWLLAPTREQAPSEALGSWLRTSQYRLFWSLGK